MGTLPQNPEVHKTEWTNGRTRLNHTNLTAGINSNLDALKSTVEGIITALGGAGVSVYTKLEIITALGLKADKADVDTALALKADKTEVNAALALKADKSTTYTKDEVNAALDLKADKTEVNTALALKADKSTTYTKTEVNTALDLKADKSTTYTKTEVDTALALKADKSDTYTKTEVNTALAEKADKNDTYTKGQIDATIAALDTLEIRIVQTLPPTGQSKIIYFVPREDDEPGDVYDEYVWVVVSGTGSYEKIGNTDIDLSDYATKTYVTNALAGYYTATQVDTALNLKADKSSLTNVVYFEADAA